MTDEPTRPAAGAYASVALAASLWGTWTIFLRPARVDPRWSSAIIMAAMAVFGAPLLARRSGRLPNEGRSRADWTWLAVLAVSDAANAWLFFGALARATVAVAVLSHYLAPALVALVAPRLLGTPRQSGALARALVGTAGLVLVLEPWRMRGAGGGANALGAALGAGSAVFYAVNVCASKRLARAFTPEEVLVYHSAGGALLLCALALAAGAPPASVRGAVILASAGAAIGITAAVLFVRGVGRVPAEHASVLTLLEPLVAVAVGAALYGERPGPIAAVGGMVVLGSAVASARAR